MQYLIEILLGILILVIIIISSVKTVWEYQRGVIFRLGKLKGVKGPGLIFIIPFIDKMIKMDLRLVSIDVARQEIMTKDNVPATIDAVVYFNILNPDQALTKTQNYYQSTFLIAQTTLRSVLGQSTLDELLSQRDSINQNLQGIIDKQTLPWGIKVQIVEIKDVSLPETMKRAMAKQAEAERERRAKIIDAEGEYQSAEKLVQAANIMKDNPIALQLRYLRSLTEVSDQPNKTVVFPFPIDLITPFLVKKRDN